MQNFLGSQYRGILDLYRILFHAVVVFGPEHYFLFKSASTYCEQQQCKGQQACLLFLAIFLCCSTFQSQLKTTKAFCFRLCIDMLKQYHTGLVSQRGGVDSTKENLIYCRQASGYQVQLVMLLFEVSTMEKKVQVWFVMIS